MSRKTSRIASGNQNNGGVRPAADRDRSCSNTELRRLALGSLAAAVSGALHAQEAAKAADPNANPASQPLEEVVVTGLRASLQRNLDIKREAPGVMDVISSEDIGKFPDSNVAASLQRVPGVSIQRSGTRGEPTGITVRGFGGDFNETLYDGRRISTATGGRGVDFSTVGADFVSAIEVMKTPDITLSSSSIGATVNVDFPKPFDHPGMRLVGSAAASEQDRAKAVKPTAGLLFSDTFADDKLGILVDGIYTEHDTKTNRVFVSGWEGGKFDPCQKTATCTGALNPSIVGWWQQQFGAEQSAVADKRIDGRVAFQWHPSDQVLLTVDDNYSRQAVTTATDGFALWFGLGDLRSVTMDSNGTVTNFIQGNTPMDLNGGLAVNVLKTNQTGVNLKIDASEHLHFDIDASLAKSWDNPNGEGSDGGDIGYGGTLACPSGVAIVGDSSSHLPQLSAFGPACSAANYLNPADIGSHVLVRTFQQNTDTLKQGRFSLKWEQDGLKLDLGTSYVTDEFTLHNSNTFANNFWQAYAGYGPPSGRTSGLVVPTSVYDGTIGTSGFIHGFSGSGTLPPSLLVYDPRALYAYLQGLGDPWQKQINGFNYPNGTLANSAAACAGANPPALCNYHGVLSAQLDPGSIQDIEEKTWSVFFRTTLEAKVGDKPFHFSAGVRDERTTVHSAGQGRVPTLLTQSAADPTLLTTTFSGTQPISTSSNYNFLLPSMDAKLELTPSFQIRFDASRTLTRPAINFLTPVLNVGSLPRVGALTANGGNPALKPYLSDNFDLGAEWYYAPNSYLAIDGFVKDVTNFIVQGTTRQTINDVIDPTTGQKAIYTVSARVNGPDARVDGVEVAWQHVFGESGFGFDANATFVDTNKPYNKNDISQSGFAVTGLANSANLIGFYDKNGFEARIAANWRDEYLLQFGQNQNNSAFGAEPTYVNSSLQIDFGSSYQITSQLNVFFEALNVTDETQSTHGRYKNQLLDVFDYGRRYALGVRFRM
jgi:iron complex outermembrane recepter protein